MRGIVHTLAPWAIRGWYCQKICVPLPLLGNYSPLQDTKMNITLFSDDEWRSQETEISKSFTKTGQSKCRRGIPCRGRFLANCGAVIEKPVEGRVTYKNNTPGKLYSSQETKISKPYPWWEKRLLAKPADWFQARIATDTSDLLKSRVDSKKKREKVGLILQKYIKL